MRKLMIIALILAFAAGGAFAAKSTFTPPILPQPADSSGSPDAYGYTWVDNNNGGSPVYNWVDITGIGTLVEGLFDDNVVGSFPIGFDFPYYWYTVDHINIGSNGFISFSSMVSYSQDFAPIPSTSDPDDIVCPLAADLDFTSPYGTNECYYYTNNVDSVVISWVDVAEWRENPVPNTEHTFQLILCAADSSITFQYGAQEGDFQNPDGATSIGIEDLIGGTGVNYLSDLNPPVHVPVDGRVVRIHADPDPDFVFEDVGISGVMNQSSGAIFNPTDSVMTLGTYVRNAGTVAMTDIPVNCKVKRSYFTDYDQTINIASLGAGEETFVEFPMTYTPEELQIYSIIMRTMLQDDFFFNNTDTLEMRTYEFNPDFRFTYADTVFSYTYWTGGGGGFANEFIAPEPIEITQISANLSSDGSESFWYLLPADENGSPDENNILFADTTTASGEGWVDMPVPGGIRIYTGEKFFVSVIADSVGVMWGMDTSWPLSKRGWEYVGSYTPSRDRGAQDIGIRFVAEHWVGVDDEVPVPDQFALNQNYPNPFNATTEITFDIEAKGSVTLDIYNIAGQKIRTLVDGEYPAGNHHVVWDGSNDNGSVVSSGVYFYKLSVNNRSETRKMVLLK